MDYCHCDYTMPEFCNIVTRKARKAHKCFECRATINPGETYEYTSGKWDGEVDDFRTCALCAELREWARISVPCFCWGYGHLHENVRDMVEEVYRGVPGFILEWGRRIIKIQRRLYGEHWPRRYLKHKPRRSAADIAAEARP